MVNGPTLPLLTSTIQDSVFINYSKQFYSQLKASMKYTGKEQIITKVNYPLDGLIKIKFFHSMEELTSWIMDPNKIIARIIFR